MENLGENYNIKDSLYSTQTAVGKVKSNYTILRKGNYLITGCLKYSLNDRMFNLT